MQHEITQLFLRAPGLRYIIPPGFFSPTNSTIATTKHSVASQQTISADAIRVFIALELSPQKLGEIFSQQMSTIPDFLASQAHDDLDDNIPLSSEDIFELPHDSPYAFLKNRYMNMLDWKGWFRIALLTKKITKVVLQSSLGVNHDQAFFLVDPSTLEYEFGNEYKLTIGSKLLMTLKVQVENAVRDIRAELL